MMRFSRLRWRSRTYSGARSGSPISSVIFCTASAAPPCSGPLSVPMAVTMAECRSRSVEAVTRAAKAEALAPCSACRRKSRSMALGGFGAGLLAVEHVEEVGGVAEVARAARPAPGRGGCGGGPRRWSGTATVRRSDLRMFGVARVVLGVRVEGATARDGGAQHVHGVGVLTMRMTSTTPARQARAGAADGCRRPRAPSRVGSVP